MQVPKRRPAILIVDDDFDIRELVVDLLHDAGFEVFSANDGRQALLEMKSRAVKLVLLDLNMPTMDGHAFREHQLADPALSSIPVVVFSGRDDYATTAASLGAAAAFQKPFSPDALLSALERFR
jgi:CheY-like chemotaxis protein